MAAPEALINAPEFTVTELSSALKRTVEDAYGHVRVRGENPYLRANPNFPNQ